MKEDSSGRGAWSAELPTTQVAIDMRDRPRAETRVVQRWQTRGALRPMSAGYDDKIPQRAMATAIARQGMGMVKIAKEPWLRRVRGSARSVSNGS